MGKGPAQNSLLESGRLMPQSALLSLGVSLLGLYDNKVQEYLYLVSLLIGSALILVPLTNMKKLRFVNRLFFDLALSITLITFGLVGLIGQIS